MVGAIGLKFCKVFVSDHAGKCQHLHSFTKFLRDSAPHRLAKSNVILTEEAILHFTHDHYLHHIKKYDQLVFVIKVN